MAKKTFVVEVNTAAKKQAFAALLTVLGFEKTGRDSFAEIATISATKAKTASTPRNAKSSTPAETQNVGLKNTKTQSTKPKKRA